MKLQTERDKVIRILKYLIYNGSLNYEACMILEKYIHNLEIENEQLRRSLNEIKRD